MPEHFHDHNDETQIAQLISFVHVHHQQPDRDTGQRHYRIGVAFLLQIASTGVSSLGKLFHMLF